MAPIRLWRRLFAQRLTAKAGYLKVLRRSAPQLPDCRQESCGDRKIRCDYAANPGGGGAGIGEPLPGAKLKPGGGGAGIGEPLAIMELLDKSLTELITGSTIEKARTHNASRMMILFFMDEPSWLQP